jgi:hypothetical protein
MVLARLPLRFVLDLMYFYEVFSDNSPVTKNTGRNGT